ncbi:MAG: hypothetical protein JK586_05025 [Nocardiopsis sp. BM-2018]|nr:MAG: hypothetical protein JK586_05025 [Nocardiopsis sp. BM-2018]
MTWLVGTVKSPSATAREPAAGETHHYEAWCEQDGRAWSVDAPELRVHTFGHTLHEAEEMARDTVPGVLGVPVGNVTVSLRVQDPGSGFR